MSKHCLLAIHNFPSTTEQNCHTSSYVFIIMPHCCVSECTNRHERTPKLPFYKFSVADKTKQKWLEPSYISLYLSSFSFSLSLSRFHSIFPSLLLSHTISSPLSLSLSIAFSIYLSLFLFFFLFFLDLFV